MNWQKKLVFYFYFLIINQLFGQNYIEYHRIFNRIDDDVLTENLSLASQRLDSVYEAYDFIYAKHCIKALQIYVTLKDSVKSDLWLAKCFKQGIPIWIIRSNKITNEALRYSNTHNTILNFDSLNLIYKTRINIHVSELLDSLIKIDSKLTRNLNDGFILLKPFYWIRWKTNNRRQLKIIKIIITKFGYPEEKLIGLPAIQDSTTFSKYLSFWGPSELRDSRAQIMLQHCFTDGAQIDEKLKDMLYSNLTIGNIPAFQYALILEFMYPDRSNFSQFKFWPYRRNPLKFDNHNLNKNRYAIGLQSIEQEQRNILIERNRRKNSVSNAEIMLE